MKNLSQLAGKLKACGHPLRLEILCVIERGEDTCVSELWNFDYIWEVYKPVKQRQWGYYVLPVLYQDRFVGRFDGKYDTKSGTFNVITYHEEPNGLPITHSAVEAAFNRFLRYLGGDTIKLPAKRKRRK